MRQVGKDLLDHHRIFNAGDDLDGVAAAVADLDVDVENALQALPPSHCGPAFSGRSVFGRIRRASLVALAAFGRRHLRTMRTIGGENAVKSSQVDPGLGYQGDEPGDEVQWLGERPMDGQVGEDGQLVPGKPGFSNSPLGEKLSELSLKWIEIIYGTPNPETGGLDFKITMDTTPFTRPPTIYKGPGAPG